jgi:hypothetical protein
VRRKGFIALKRITDSRLIDIIAIAVANLMNLIMIPIFLLRIEKVEHPQVVELIWIALILVLAVVVVVNIMARREWWTVVFPLLLGVFLMVEVALDYIARIDFRSTNLLVPYLLLYYISILGMIGYSFAAQKKVGFITLVTYFLSQIAAFYSYIKVGHG